MVVVAQPVDAGALRRWAGAALAVLGRAREEIDALNVFPIADSDTGTNMYLTFEAACRALDDRLAAPGPAPTVPEALQSLAHGALLGARGNSGVILSQLLRGAAAARYTGLAVDGTALAVGLAAAAESAYEAVARPAEGTILTVAGAAAEAASAAAVQISALAADRAAASSSASSPAPSPGPAPDGAEATAVAEATEAPETSAPATSAPTPLTPTDSLAYVAQAAAAGAREALIRTPEQLDVLRRNNVVDAGGLGLVVILETLAAYTGGTDPRHAFRQRRLSAGRAAAAATHFATGSSHGPAFEVIYLLEAADSAVTGPTGLRARLDDFCEQGGGDSLVVVGGGGLWRVHVHVHDPGFAVEAGIAAGRPSDIRITHLAAQPAAAAEHRRAEPRDAAAVPLRTRAVVAVAYGPGLAGLFEEAGARVIRTDGDRPPSAADFERAVAETRAGEVVLLPNDTETTTVAAAVAERFQAGARPVRVAAVPAKASVQGIAALAVHEPARRFDADVVAMTAAAGATRHGAIEVARTEAWTMAGVCHPGQVLGHIEHDVALIGDEAAATAGAVLDRMLSAGGEMVTLVVGDGAAPGLSEAVADYLRERHPLVDVVVYDGGQPRYPLMIGVE